MSLGKGAAHRAEKLKGKVKEQIGKLSDNPKLTAEGRVTQFKATVKQAGKKIKGALHR